MKCERCGVEPSPDDVEAVLTGYCRSCRLCIQGLAPMSIKPVKPKINDLLSMDKECGMPNLIPGDTVRMNSGTVAVIVDSAVVINGSHLKWYDILPKDIRHGHKPSYSLSIVGNGMSWYTVDDFKEVLGLSLLRDTEAFLRMNK